MNVLGTQNLKYNDKTNLEHKHELSIIFILCSIKVYEK